MDANRPDLLEQWLEYFGATVAHELDLGTLAVIKKFIDEGRAPSSGADSSADVHEPHQEQSS